MIEVFEQIKPLLEFESDDDFYLLQILQRKKDNPSIGSNSRLVKSYYVNNLEYLEKRYDEIKMLCDNLNARAMLRVNKRSYRKVAMKTIQKMVDCLASNQNKFPSKAYDRACGSIHNAKNKRWIIDIDNEEDKKVTQEDVDKVINGINSCMPNGDKIIMQLPTKNGIHLITSPFNVKEFSDKGFTHDIHKDNPINLYIP